MALLFSCPFHGPVTEAHGDRVALASHSPWLPRNFFVFSAGGCCGGLGERYHLVSEVRFPRGETILVTLLSEAREGQAFFLES